MRDHHILYILCAGLVFFTLVIITVSVLFPTNERLQTLFFGVFSGFSASLFTWLQLKGKDESK